MSSFDYTDNFSGFNDLINRAEILEEKNWKKMVGAAKLRPEFAQYKAEDPKTGLKNPPGGLSRLANLLYITALGEAHLGMISGEAVDMLAGRSTSSTEIAKMLAKIDPEVFEELFNDENPKSVEVAEYVNNPENRPKLVQYIIKNFTPKNREFLKDVDPEDLDDAVGDAVDDIESAADDMESRFEKGVLGAVSSEADLKARISELDFDDVDVSLEELENKDEIAAKIVELLNTTDNLTAEVTPIGFNIEGPVGVFVDSDTITDQMNRLITKYFPNVGGRDIPVRLNTSVGEEDYEQIDDDEYEGPSMANNPGGAPSSYAQGEEGGGITAVEDNEDWIQGAVKGIKKKGTEGALTRAAKAADESMSEYCASPPSKLAKKRCQFRANVSDEEGEEKRYDATNVQLMKLIQNDIMNGMSAKESIEGLGVDPAYQKDLFRRYQKWADRWSEGPIEPESWFENEEYDGLELDHFLTKEQPEDSIPSTDYEEVLDSLVKKDKEEHAMKKLNEEGPTGGGLTTVEEQVAPAKPYTGVKPHHYPTAWRWRDKKKRDPIRSKADVDVARKVAGWKRGEAPRITSDAGKTWQKNPLYDVKYLPGEKGKVAAPTPPQLGKPVPGRGSKPTQKLHAASAGRRPVSPTNIARTPPADTAVQSASREFAKNLPTPAAPAGDEEGRFEGQPEPTPEAKAHRQFRDKYPQRYGPQFHFDEETGIWTAESGGKVIYRSDTGDVAEESEEEFNYSPMLDSYQTSTAGYLTEQTASDNRNKKSEVKKQSFKEKYKPKTHWQLEELRKYGL